MKNTFLLALLLMIGVKTMAAEVPISEITHIATWEQHVDVHMSAAGVDPEGCGASDLYRLDLANDPGAQEKLSVLLSSFMAEKNVGLSITGCVGNRPRIRGVRLPR